jgi:hypothetical protein
MTSHSICVLRKIHMNNRKVYKAEELAGEKCTKTSCPLLYMVQAQVDNNVGKPARHCNNHDIDHDEQHSRVLSRHTNASRMARAGTPNLPRLPEVYVLTLGILQQVPNPAHLNTTLTASSPQRIPQKCTENVSACATNMTARAANASRTVETLQSVLPINNELGER